MTPLDGPQQPPRSGDPTGEPAEARPDASTGAGGGDAPPASVAEEAAKLVELLSGGSWAGAGVPPSGSAGRTGTGEQGQARECTCGGTTPRACRVCPVCQLIAFVQQVNPDTIEKVADFVGFAATALRELATAQRERQEPERRADQTAGPDGTTGPDHAGGHADAGRRDETHDTGPEGER